MWFALRGAKEKKQLRLVVASSIMLTIGFISLILADDMNRLLLSVVCLFMGLFLLALVTTDSNWKKKT